MFRVSYWRRSVDALLVLILFLLCGATAEAKSESSQPVVVKLLTFDIALTADGLSTEIVHSRVAATNAAAANEIGQEPVRYSASTQSVDILEAFTEKSDGRKLPVSQGSIYEQPAPGAPQMPMFDDERQKTIIFPDVQAGDVIDYTYRVVRRAALIPGQFTLLLPFSRLYPYDDVKVTLTAPKTYPLNVATHDMSFQKRDAGANVVYTWRYSAPTPLTGETTIVSPLERAPRLLVSSFADFDTLGHTYAGLVAPTIAVTPAIQQKADQIARGAGSRRAQAERIYDWVSRHIRYVAVEVGQGAIVPHGADSVLANGYGDCKDHAALFVALLKAKGIEGQLALINYGPEYQLPDAAIVAAFNHVIVWLPEFQVFADTTSGVAPFGVLSFAEYGKPVVLAVAAGAAVSQTPLLPPGVATAGVRTTVKLDDQGRFVGKNVMTGTGPFAIMLRSYGLAIQAVGPERTVEEILRKTGTPGTGTYTIPSPDQLESDYEITADFTLGPFSDVMGGRRFAMPSGLSLMGSPGSFLMGPLDDRNIADSEPTPCYSGNEREDITLEPPPGHRFLLLPDDTSIRTSSITFTQHWSRDGDSVVLHREFESRIGTSLCSGDLRKEAASALAKVRESYTYGVAISKSLSSAEGKFFDSLNAGLDAFKKKDMAAAIRNYSDALDAPAGEPQKSLGYVHFLRSGAYLVVGRYDEALADLDAAVSADASFAAKYAHVAEMLENLHEYAYAERVWTSALAHDPGDAASYDGRGIVRDYLGNHDGAIADFANAIARSHDSQKLAVYFDDRSGANWARHNWQAAIADATEAINRDAKHASAYRARAIAEYFAGEVDAAAADWNRAAALNPRDLYAQLWIFVTEKRQGKNAAAELARRTQGLDLSTWPGPLIRVARGDIRPDAIPMPVRTVAWQSRRDECERDFYLAEIALLSGDSGTAARLFRTAIATDVKEYIEYQAAGAELQRMSG